MGAGALAFTLYDPTSSAPGRLSLSQLIVAPEGVEHRTGEPPVEQTDSPALAALARRYQPTLVVSAFDRFWPVSLTELLGARWSGHVTCLYVDYHCRIRSPAASVLTTGHPSDYLRFPTPVDNVKATFASAALELGVPLSVIRAWTSHPDRLDPFPSAQEYFYYLPRTTRHSYPGAPAGMVSLEYWFFYPLNYLPLVRIPLEALTQPITSTLANTDYHQGDLEHVAVLLDSATLAPRYLWMARHADEGQLYRWGSRAVQWQSGHPVVYAALGSHASYAHCGIQRRSRTFWFINDYVVCIPHQTFAFTYQSTPLADMSHIPWTCWRGHLGDDGRSLIRKAVWFVPFETGGPISPLRQQENFHTACAISRGERPPVTPVS